MTSHPDTVTDCTSQVFEGLITLSDPKGSWVAKWQRLEGYQEGVYATKVVGAVGENSFEERLSEGGRRQVEGRVSQGVERVYGGRERARRGEIESAWSNRLMYMRRSFLRISCR